MNAHSLNRRSLTTIAVAVIAGTASVAGVGFAQDNSGPAGAATGARQAPAGILAGVHTGLENLVAQGTINEHQADIIQRQANAGSIDPKSLVQSGAVSDAQMRAVANTIDQVKRAAGN